MLVVGLGVIAVAGYYAFLTMGLKLDIQDAAQSRIIVDSLVAPLRRIADLDLRPSRRGISPRAPTSAPTWWARSKGRYTRRRSAQCRRDRDNVGDNVGDCAAWPRICSKPSR